MDIATANTGPNTVAVHLNGGPAGGFLAARETAVGTGPFAIAAGDLNRDGIPDLVVTTPDNGSGTLEVLLMGRDGRAATRTIATVGQSRGLSHSRTSIATGSSTSCTPIIRAAPSPGEATRAVAAHHRAQPESTLAGNWQRVADATAADGTRLFYPNANAPKVTAVVPNPSNYVDVWFIADPTQSYKLWVRLKAQDPAYRIGTASGLEVNLEECSGCGISGWGWEDDGWGAVNRNGGLLRFPDGGGQQLRIQIREDGVSVDQIVLSAVKYRSARPGRAKNDTVILPVTHHAVE